MSWGLATQPKRVAATAFADHLLTPPPPRSSPCASTYSKQRAQQQPARTLEVKIGLSHCRHLCVGHQQEIAGTCSAAPSCQWWFSVPKTCGRAMFEDRLLGKVVLVLGSAAFLYYSAWVLLTARPCCSVSVLTYVLFLRDVAARQFCCPARKLCVLSNAGRASACFITLVRVAVEVQCKLEYVSRRVAAVLNVPCGVRSRSWTKTARFSVCSLHAGGRTRCRRCLAAWPQPACSATSAGCWWRPSCTGASMCTRVQSAHICWLT